MKAKEVMFKGNVEDVIWKSEVSDLSSDAKIYSRKDCDIIILKKGAFLGVYDDKEESYILSDEKKGFFSNFLKKADELEDCEIFYINRLAQLENKWGTPNRIDIYDQTYDIHTSVGSHGSYRFSIKDSMKLMSKVLGSGMSLSQEMVRDFFKSELSIEIRNSIANVFHENKYGLKQIAVITTFEKEIADKIHSTLIPIFEDYGVRLDRFFIAQFSYDEEFLQQISSIRKKAILKQMVRESEEDERLEKREDFKMVTDAVERIKKTETKPEVHIHHNNATPKFCPQCGHRLSTNAKYCDECGSKISE